MTKNDKEICYRTCCVCGVSISAISEALVRFNETREYLCELCFYEQYDDNKIRLIYALVTRRKK